MTAKILGSEDRFPIGAQRAYDNVFIEAESYCLEAHEQITNKGITALETLDEEKVISYVRDLRAISKKEKWASAQLNKDHNLIFNSLHNYESLIFNHKIFENLIKDFDSNLQILQNGNFTSAQTQLSKLQLKEQYLKQSYEAYKISLISSNLPTDAVADQYNSISQRSIPVFKDLENLVRFQTIVQEEEQVRLDQNKPDFQKLRTIFARQHQDSKIDLLNLRVLFGKKQQGHDADIPEDALAQIDLIERGLRQTMVQLKNAYNGSSAFINNEERQLKEVKETIDHLREIAIDLDL